MISLLNQGSFFTSLAKRALNRLFWQLRIMIFRLAYYLNEHQWFWTTEGVIYISKLPIHLCTRRTEIFNFYLPWFLPITVLTINMGARI